MRRIGKKINRGGKMTGYKTILVHAGPPCDAAVGTIAAQLARTFNARLVSVACSGIELLLAPGIVETGSETIARHLMDRIDAASNALEALSEVALRAGVIIGETHRLNGRAEKELMEHMLYADLAVVGQGLEKRRMRNGWRTLPEQLLRNASRPVLVVPEGYAGKSCGQRALLAWDGSAAAARAVSAAMPILARAERVEAVTYSTDDGFNVPGELDSLSNFLASHGVHAQTRFLRARRNVDIGDALLGHATASGADLLVLGGYGHSRWRELVLGSVSGTVMRDLRVPALFCH
ncbi:MAG TPA: universal stress protein [Pseudoduganella sp.]